MKHTKIYFAVLVILMLHSTNLCAQKKDNNESQTKKDTTENSDSDKSSSIIGNITWLNAANFDFSTKQLSASYLGKFNLFAPGIYKKFGINTGIMKIKFNYKDSSHPFYRVDNRLINPLDSVKSSTKFLKEYNQYVSTRTNTVWSFYFQPIYKIIDFDNNDDKENNKSDNNKNGIYINAHVELLVNKTNVTTSITNIQRDTAFIDTNSARSLVYIPGNTIINDETFINGYFGAGITIMADPFKSGKSHFFFQSTFGYTTNYPNWSNQDITSTQPTLQNSGMSPVSSVRGGRLATPQYIPKSSWFYLIRSEFSQNISDQSELIIGTDIRGLFPKYNPMYAAYIGLNVSLKSIADIFSNSK